MAQSRPTSASRKATSSKGSATKKAAPDRPGIFSSHGADLAALGLLTAGILVALAVWFHALGPVGHALNSALGALVGSARYLVPLLLLGGAVAALARREQSERRGLWIGGSLAVLSICGLFGLSNGTPTLGSSRSTLTDAGGYLGAITGGTLARALGTVGAAVLLLAVLIVAVIVATGIPLRTLGSSSISAIRALWDMVTKWWAGGPLGAAADRRPIPNAPDDEGPPQVEAAEQSFTPPVEPSPLLPDEEPAPLLSEAARKPRSKKAEAATAVSSWLLPPLSLLHQTAAQRHDKRAVDAAGVELVTALAAHGVETTLVGCTVGPTVTRYELELGPGVKVARVTSLSKDIAYAMASPDVRILAPIPGRSAIGVEVPNRQRHLVTLGDLLASEEAAASSDPLSVAIGRDIAGRTVMVSLAEFPHVLISGATGAGKSSAINSLITSILMRSTPEQVRLILVDPKRVELGQYNDLPHLLTPVVVDPKKAANALAWAVKEMERRYDILAEHGVRDITSYHEALAAGQLSASGPPDLASELALVAARAKATAHDEPFDAEAAQADVSPVDFDPLPFVVVVVDELNDLMMVAARDVEESVVRIAQMARAVGIHLVLATQRPSVDVITGVIKANVPSRMAFSVSSLADSRVILDQPGAERLVGKGDMLMLTASSNVARRIQAPWVSEEEVRDVVAFWRRQGGTTEPAVALSDSEVTTRSEIHGGDDDDELLIQARDLIVRSQLGSTSMLQRKLRVGFARAGRLMDLLEQQGVVGPSTGSKARAVLMTPDELDQLTN